MADVKKFTVERDRWFRGDRNGSRLVRASDGTMCCLGFLGLALGNPRDHLVDRPAPGDTAFSGCSWPSWMLTSGGGNSMVAGELMSINDDRTITDETRERSLTELFLRNGVEVEFR